MIESSIVERRPVLRSSFAARSCEEMEMRLFNIDRIMNSEAHEKKAISTGFRVWGDRDCRERYGLKTNMAPIAMSMNAGMADPSL